MAGSLVACGAGSTSTGSATASPALSGSITVFAGAGLKLAFDAEAAAFKRLHPGTAIMFNYAGTPQLLSQLESGAKGDILAVAAQSYMDRAVSEGLVTGSPRVVARDRLEMVVAKGNPKGIKSLADLARADLKVVLGQPSLPVGMEANTALAKQHITVHPVSLEVEAPAITTKVALGEADAGIVHATDLAVGGSNVTGVTIPDAENVPESFPTAATTSSANPALARAFLDFLLSSQGQAIMRQHGYLPT